MEVLYKPKILWAFAVGLGLVSLAYYASNQAEGVEQAGSLSVTEAEPGLRAPLPVSDSDDNGIEDWREEFVNESLTISKAIDYDPKQFDSVTAQTGINLIKDLIYAKNLGPIGGKGPDQVVQETIDELASLGEGDYLYGKKDVIVIEQYEDEDVINYANEMALALYEETNDSYQNELIHLDDLVRGNDPEAKNKLLKIGEYYKLVRDRSLVIPVPKSFLKAHTDLINVYNALYEDINKFALVNEDPLPTLVRLQRYNDDALALGLTFKNFSSALQPYFPNFKSDDAGMIFSAFNSEET